MKINVFLFYDEPLEESKYPKLDKHYQWIVLKKSQVDTFAKLTEKLREYHPLSLVTIREQEWQILFKLPYDYRRRWINYAKLEEVTQLGVINCTTNVINSSRWDKENPLFSIITTTFHSGKKILRPYNSLQQQTYNNWEWVIWDDSDPKHLDVWNQLLSFRKDDIRISCYRDVQNSGFIGDMKWKAASLTRGNFIVEVDHDDLLDSNLLEICRDAIMKHPDVDFLCSDCVELYEDSEEPFNYGDSFSFGYGSSNNQWLRGKWHTVLANGSINPETIRHIVGVPNHVRIWRKEFYDKLGRHNSEMPVVDDYELLLRTFFEARKLVRIPKPLYFQYRNNGGNNFTFIRNSLIQHITSNTQSFYEDKIRSLFKSKNIHDYVGLDKWPPRVVAWNNSSKFKYGVKNNMYVIYDPDLDDNTCSIVMTSQSSNPVNLKTQIRSIIAQSYTNWVLYIIGSNSTILAEVMDDFSKEVEILCKFSKIRWWNMSTKEGTSSLKNYALRMLVNTRLVTYVDGDSEKYILSDVLEKSLEELKESNSRYINRKLLLHEVDLLHEFGDWSQNNSIEEFVGKFSNKI